MRAFRLKKVGLGAHFLVPGCFVCCFDNHGTAVGFGSILKRDHPGLATLGTQITPRSELILHGPPFIEVNVWRHFCLVRIHSKVKLICGVGITRIQMICNPQVRGDILLLIELKYTTYTGAFVRAQKMAISVFRCAMLDVDFFEA